MSIYIPLRGRHGDHVELPLDQLTGTEPKDLIRMLVDERVPLEIWLRVAVRSHLELLSVDCPLYLFLNMISML